MPTTARAGIAPEQALDLDDADLGVISGNDPADFDPILQVLLAARRRLASAWA